MKVIKLNRRYRLFKEHGYQAGLRFNTYGPTAQNIEKTCRERLGSSGYMWPSNSDWTGYFGKRNVDGPTPYFIMFQKESDLSFVLLCADLTKNA
jgi:hypothetical protein